MDAMIAYVVLSGGCLLAVAGIVIVLLARRARRRAARPPRVTDRFRAASGADPFRAASGADPFRAADDDADALRGDPRRLAPGDIVEIRGTSYGVRGTVRCTQGQWGWSEHLLDDARQQRAWLSVEEDPDLELVLWHAVGSATVSPGQPTVDFDGRRYTGAESGRARYTAVGTTGLDPSGSLRYHDYRAPDGARLSFEAYGDSDQWELARGEPLHRAEVMIYPASGHPDGKH